MKIFCIGIVVFSSTFALFGNGAFAAGSHVGGHGELPVGEPGKKSQVDRTVKVVMKETDDGKMLFEPSELIVQQGETIRFAIENKGETDHEFVLDDAVRMEEHKKLMMEFPEMEHDDPNSVRLEPGKKGDVIWRFSNAGSFIFGCLIPGHMESGMHGPVEVTETGVAN